MNNPHPKLPQPQGSSSLSNQTHDRMNRIKAHTIKGPLLGWMKNKVDFSSSKVLRKANAQRSQFVLAGDGPLSVRVQYIDAAPGWAYWKRTESVNTYYWILQLLLNCYTHTC